MTRGARGQGVGRLIFEVGALYLGSSGTRASVKRVIQIQVRVGPTFA